jgi:hypothetical protein
MRSLDSCVVPLLSWIVRTVHMIQNERNMQLIVRCFPLNYPTKNDGREAL